MRTSEQRIAQLEKNKIPPKVEVNPYLAFSKAELLAMVKSILESGEPMTDELRRQAEAVLHENKQNTDK